MPNEKIIYAMNSKLLFMMFAGMYGGLAILLFALWLAPLATLLTFTACILIWIGVYVYLTYYTKSQHNVE